MTSGASRSTNFRDLLKSASLRPLVCATIFARDKSAFLTAAKTASSIGCGLVELRIDHLDERKTMAQMHQIMTESPLPLIATCRSQRDGGAFSLSREERRLELMESAIQSKPAFVDLELEINQRRRTMLFRLAKRVGVGIICSHHDFIATPSTKTILSLATQIEKTKPNISKLVFTPHDDRDSIRILTIASTLSKRKLHFTVFGMGKIGKITRLANLLFGGCLVYCSVNKAQTSLGQINATYATNYLSRLSNERLVTVRNKRQELLKYLNALAMKHKPLDYRKLDITKNYWLKNST